MKNSFSLVRFIRYIGVTLSEYSLSILVCSLVLFVITNMFVGAIANISFSNVSVFFGNFADFTRTVSSFIITLYLFKHALKRENSLFRVTIPVSRIESYLTILFVGLIVPQIAVELIISLSLPIQLFLFDSQISLIEVKEQLEIYYKNVNYIDSIIDISQFTLIISSLFLAGKRVKRTNKYIDNTILIITIIITYIFLHNYGEQFRLFRNEYLGGYVYLLLIGIIAYFTYKKAEIK